MKITCRRFAVARTILALAGLGRGTIASATPLTPLNYSLTPNGPVFYGYDDNSYHPTGLGNPVAGDLTGGIGDLADGAFGMPVGGGYWAWSPYVLWNGISPTITFDFGSSHHFDAVTLRGLSYNAAAVYSLPGAAFSTSLDGSTFAPVQSAVFTGVEGNDATYAFTVLGEAGLEGRYLQMQLESSGRWIALSEIQVDGTAVPDALPTGLYSLLALGIMAYVSRRRR